jgi:hypothetical protein
VLLAVSSSPDPRGLLSELPVNNKVLTGLGVTNHRRHASGLVEEGLDVSDRQIWTRIAELEQAQQDSRAAAARGDISRLRELADLADLEESISRARALVRIRNT